jgi:hypothetical protein
VLLVPDVINFASIRVLNHKRQVFLRHLTHIHKFEVFQLLQHTFSLLLVTSSKRTRPFSLVTNSSHSIEPNSFSGTHLTLVKSEGIKCQNIRKPRIRHSFPIYGRQHFVCNPLTKGFSFLLLREVSEILVYLHLRALKCFIVFIILIND